MAAAQALPPPSFPLSSNVIGRYLKFAHKGGIGKAVALTDKEKADTHDLMFLQGDPIIVLVDLGNHEYLGYCEGVLGIFLDSDVRFLTKLKKPILVSRALQNQDALINSMASENVSAVKSRHVPQSLAQVAGQQDRRMETRLASKFSDITTDLPQRAECKFSDTTDYAASSIGLPIPRHGTLSSLADTDRPLSSSTISVDLKEILHANQNNANRSRSDDPDPFDNETSTSYQPREATELIGSIFDSYRDATGSDSGSAYSELLQPPKSSDGSQYPSDVEDLQQSIQEPQQRSFNGIPKVSPAHSIPPEPTTTALLKPSSANDMMIMTNYIRRIPPNSPTPANNTSHSSNSDGQTPTSSQQYSRHLLHSPIPAFGASPLNDSPAFVQPDEPSRPSKLKKRQGVRGLSISAPKNNISLGTGATAVPRHELRDIPIRKASLPGFRSTPQHKNSSSDPFTSNSGVVSRHPRGGSLSNVLSHKPSLSLVGLKLGSKSRDGSLSGLSALDSPMSTSHSSPALTSHGLCPNKFPSNPSLSSIAPESTLKSKKSSNLRVKTSQLLRKNSGLASPTNSAAADNVEELVTPDTPSSARTANGSILGFKRKASTESRRELKTDYSMGISSKDFEQETLKLGHAEFDLVKPHLEALMSKSDDTSTVISLGDPSRSMDFGESALSEVSSSIGSQTHDWRSPVTVPMSVVDIFRFEASTITLGTITPELVGDKATVDDHMQREMQWIRLTSTAISPELRKSKKSRTLVKSGVPSSVRGKVYGWLVGVEQVKVGGLYKTLCDRQGSLMDEEIQQDIHLTYVNGSRFSPGSSGRADLVSVLSAISRYLPELGYGEGFTQIAAVLLTLVPAEETFWIIVALIQKYNFSNYFQSQRQQLALETCTFGHLLDLEDPELYEHLIKLGVQASDFYPRWLSSLFATALPWETRLRAIDLVLFDPGFGYKISMAILKITRHALLGFNSKVSVLQFFCGLPTSTLPPAKLLSVVFDVRIKDKIRKAMKRAEVELSANSV